ncbi:alpha/beta fold hydrolase [Caenimonas sedimenti]|uniref:Alpha/beta fold hydrolase n=1 Tax=Caenimonas sedimenti TaxID=2596921 RepID=A0A562ZM73_9BURK|nr:alpha/beta hydrolase [Caenimonas sedimenti]TWO69517.1 alpha/beta fold hydrolase [Caenimonas sedimenti]
MKAAVIVTSCIAALLVLAFAAAIAFGGPAKAAPLASVNAPFAKVDFSAVPPARRFQARDGASLAWLHYPATGTQAPNGRRVVLVHGSSGRGQSMHMLAQGLAQAGFSVASLDMRGHGDSGPRGHAAYIGQLEDDVEDFMKAVPHAGPSTLVGFSSGGGFALRMAGGSRQQLFDRYVLLAPFLRHDAPTNKPGNDHWAAVGLPRMIALTMLDRFGIRAWGDLPVLNFALDEAASRFLTPSYSFTLASAFGPGDDYRASVRNARGDVRLVAGSADELFDAPRYAEVLAAAGRTVPVTLVPGVNHIGLTLEPAAVAAVVRACH